MTGIFQQYQQLMSTRTEISTEDEDLPLNMKKLVAALGNMRVSGQLEHEKTPNHLIARAGSLPEADQKTLADRVVTWHSGQEVLKERIQNAQNAAEAKEEHALNEFNRLKETNAYTYFYRILPRSIRQEMVNMKSLEIDALILSSAIKFNQELASISSGKPIQAIIEGKPADLQENIPAKRKRSRDHLIELKKKTAYQLIKEAIIKERKDRKQYTQPTDSQWDVLIRTKSDALYELTQIARDAKRTHERISSNSFYNESNRDMSKETQEENENRETVDDKKPDSFEHLSMVDLKCHLEFVKKIENVLVRVMKTPGQTIMNSYDGITKVLTISELIELYLYLKEWKHRMPAGIEISYMKKLEQLLELDSVELYALKKLFPIKESGPLKEEEDDDGFILLDERNFVGARSQELQGLIQQNKAK